MGQWNLIFSGAVALSLAATAHSSLYDIWFNDVESLFLDEGSYSYSYEPWDSDDDATVVTKSFSVDIPALEQTDVDFGLLVDVSGSYGDDIEQLKSLAGELVDGLAADSADLGLALATYSDYPEFGASTDSEYTLVKPFETCTTAACYEEDQQDFIDAVDTLTIEYGGDEPESQTVALVRAAEEWSWREGVLKVLAITTDASFHVPGDGSTNEDQYYSLDDVIAACTAQNIKILALKAPGSGDEMDTIADGTGGVVEETTSDSSDIVSAVLEGLESVTYNKVVVEWVCGDSDWTVTVDPSSGYENVDGGSTLAFSLTMSVPEDVAAGTTCSANVLADEVYVGGQEYTVMEDGTIEGIAVVVD